MRDKECEDDNSSDLIPAEGFCDVEEIKEKWAIPSIKRDVIDQCPTKMMCRYQRTDPYDPLAKPRVIKPIQENPVMKCLGFGKRHMDLGSAWSISLGVWYGLLVITTAYMFTNFEKVEGCRKAVKDSEK